MATWKHSGIYRPIIIMGGVTSVESVSVFGETAQVVVQLRAGSLCKAVAVTDVNVGSVYGLNAANPIDDKK
jgi:hypothetical protein